MIRVFKKIFQNQNEYAWIKSSTLLSDSDEIALEDLLNFIQCSEKSLQMKNSHFIDEYFKFALSKDCYSCCQSRSKFLLIQHLMMHESNIGADFAETFLDKKFPFLDQFQIFLQNSEENQTTLRIQIPYYQYLQRFALNIQVFLACKNQIYPLSQQEKNSYETKILCLFKISNLENIAYNYMSQMIFAIQDYSYIHIMEEIILIFWSDLNIYFNFLSNEVQNLFNNYMEFSPSLCIQFYELCIQVSETYLKLMEIFKQRNRYDYDNIFKQPKYFDQNLHISLKSYVEQCKMAIQQPKINARKLNKFLVTERSQDSKIQKNLSIPILPQVKIYSHDDARTESEVDFQKKKGKFSQFFVNQKSSGLEQISFQNPKSFSQSQD